MLFPEIDAAEFESAASEGSQASPPNSKAGPRLDLVKNFYEQNFNPKNFF